MIKFTLTEKSWAKGTYRLEVVFFVLWYGRQGTSRHVFDHPEGHGEKNKLKISIYSLFIYTKLQKFSKISWKLKKGTDCEGWKYFDRILTLGWFLKKDTAFVNWPET